jgi:alpha-1,3-rhamnosyltransferase
MTYSSCSAPLVTVILPCYNHAKYVERAVLSVIAQTYQRVQLVAIDDGSSDNSVSVLKCLQQAHEFDLIVQQNTGVCKALNRAIHEAAHGDYIALLASDDFWHPDKIKIQMDALSLNPASEFCFSQAIEFDNDAAPEQGRIFPKKCLSGQVLKDVFLRQHVPAGTILFSRRLYEQLGGFDESLKEEDWDFVIRAAALTPFTSASQALLYYRSHETNTMKTRNRADTFHQKAKILSKNFNLVSPARWYLAMTIHFIHDIILR